MSILAEPSVLQKKAEIFLERDVYPLLKNFPVSEKFSLSQEIKQSCFKLIRAAVMANNLTVVKKRLEWLDEADAEKTLLLVLFGIAKTQKYITQKKLFELQGKLNEIGRIIGGLQKFFINNGQQPKKQSTYLGLSLYGLRIARTVGTIRPATGITTMLRTRTRTSVSAPPCRLFRPARSRLCWRVLVILQGRGNPSPCLETA